MYILALCHFSVPFSYEKGTFLLYRKFLKLLEIVYNGLEIKNYIAKERMGGFAMTLFV